MAVKLRLKRMGAKKRPFYRIVAADSRVARDGKFIELIGTYNPIVEPAEVKINEEIALKWLNNGAQPTDTVRDLLSKQGIMKKFHESKMVKKDTKKEVAKKETAKKPAAKATTAKKTTTKTTAKKETATKTAAKKPAAKKTTTKKEAK